MKIDRRWSVWTFGIGLVLGAVVIHPRVTLDDMLFLQRTTMPPKGATPAKAGAPDSRWRRRVRPGEAGLYGTRHRCRSP